jgi:transmembrane sensor
MDRQEAQEILQKYNEGKATAEEIRLLENWYAAESAKQQANPQDEDYPAIREEIWARIQAQKNGRGEPAKVIRLWPRISAAAAIIFFLIVAGYLYKSKVFRDDTRPKKESQFTNDVKPGHNQATLTLANGKKIILTKGLSGLLAQQGGTSVNATQNTIIYNATPSGDQFSYNTLTTARGEQSPLPLVLADGTKVWLNAESSITFPTAFNGKERVVKLTGEAYFEVKHNDQQPFKVQTANQTIEDIGTSFNINAYMNEPASRTTLLEGAVRVNGLLLKPGQQSDGKRIETVDTDEAVAWKNGNFQFDNADIKTVMRQLIRWYDVTIEYQGNLANIHYTGTVPRRSNISAVLKMLKETGGTDYKIEGKTVTIIK